MFKESNAPTLSSKRGFPRMKEKPPQAPPKEGMYSPKTLLSILKSLSFMQEGRFLVMKRSLPKPLRRRGCIPSKRFFLSKRASPSCKKGVSLPRREPFLVLKKRPLYFQLTVFTPLSIRRGRGGEAVPSSQ